MLFDKSRVFTAVNADELKPGDKVIVADDLVTLKCCVKDNSPINTLSIIGKEDCIFRFGVKDNCVSFVFAYLVERKENCTNCGCVHCWYREKHGIDEQRLHTCSRRIKSKTKQKMEIHYRPFRDTDELIKVWIEKSKQVHSDYSLTMPYIWVRRKTDLKSCGHLVTNFNCVGVTVQGQGYAMSGLFANFEFLDGSPCGVEE